MVELEHVLGTNVGISGTKDIVKLMLNGFSHYSFINLDRSSYVVADNLSLIACRRSASLLVLTNLLNSWSANVAQFCRSC